MKMLVMDTSTLVLGVAVVEHDKVLGEFHTNLHKNHSIRLMPAIEQLLQDLEIEATDLEGIAVAVGPGSYTGIRIGVTTAKTLAYTLEIPLYTESTLTVMAMNAFRFPGVIVPMLDARRQRVYTGAYQVQGELLGEILHQQVIALSDWLEQLKTFEQPILFLGDDVGKFRSEIEEKLGNQALFGHPTEHIPRAGNLGVLAMQKWAREELATPLSFAPNYLQVTEAEANWLKKQSKGAELDDSSSRT
ncbi:tRNA (adenosine(37)-N6)-threonylcarbamoyltransferase complex dimerization subunit type 1 TsaB [Risungbinella massiliensis]|uniref:tRNA (adenosine(37)-N6)-threonylcarbamoyltransferase complex dimerization subunit type 1 TsaB n=1 Tax=Risungbinella massiliensis TaxID=1329796 RepID=UPI0005CBDFF9|nr:tRNA (adenosine(37)-N6)-threonylcarbamoyltransferase complex dimerization subunit type 1 TsaB [Risungbinella massiliensis]